MLDEMMPVAIADALPEAVIPYVTVANLGGDATEGGEMTFTFHRSEAAGDLALAWVHHTDHTGRSSTWGILRLRAKLVWARGATAPHATTSPSS